MNAQFIKLFEIFSEKVQKWLNDFARNTPNIVLAILVFVFGFYVSRMLKRGVVKVLITRNVKASATQMIANIISLIVATSFLFLALDILNLDNMLKALLAGAGVAGLAVGLALQGTLSNTFAGVFLSFRDDLGIGNQIESNGYIGVIEEINLRMVKLRTPDGNLVTIPNKNLIDNPLKNYSDKETSIIILTCGVAYDSDLERVQELVIDTISSLHVALSDKSKIKFFYKEFGDSAINFELRFPSQSKSLLEINIEKSKAIIAIKKAFDANGINIPFPIRTLDMSPTILKELKK